MAISEERPAGGPVGALRDDGTDANRPKCMIVSACGALVVYGPPQGRPVGLAVGEVGGFWDSGAVVPLSLSMQLDKQLAPVAALLYALRASIT